MTADGTGVVSTGVSGYPSSWIREIGPGVDLERASLSGANLVGVDLSGANLSGAGLTAATLTGADLSGANFTYAHLVFAGLLGANLDGANLTGAGLNSATLVGASLVGANLAGADLVGTFANEKTVWPDDFDPEAAGVKFGSGSSGNSLINFGNDYYQGTDQGPCLGFRTGSDGAIVEVFDCYRMD